MRKLVKDFWVDGDVLDCYGGVGWYSGFSVSGLLRWGTHLVVAHDYDSNRLLLPYHITK
jgi:hypothetical protein